MTWCSDFLLATGGVADLLKVAVECGRLTAALQDLEMKATKFREHASGIPQGEFLDGRPRGLEKVGLERCFHARAQHDRHEQAAVRHQSCVDCFLSGARRGSGQSLAILRHTSRTR